MAIFGHLYEVKLNNYNAHTTIDQLNACFDILSYTRSVLGAI